MEDRSSHQLLSLPSLAVEYHLLIHKAELATQQRLI